jgi:aminomethyltransferase
MKAPTLHDEHVKAGARMTEFAGWSVPLDYGSIISEAKAVRSGAGLFDISHMGRIVVEGPESFDLLSRMTTNDIQRLQVGQGQYTLTCNDRGGIKDDLIVFRVQHDSFLLVVNAANTKKDMDWLNMDATLGASVIDMTMETSLFALQGPNASSLLASAATSMPDLYRFSCGEVEIAGVRCFVSRTGYTGEDGYEFMCVNAVAPRTWEALSSTGQPSDPVLCGLGARDVLRIEAGYVLYDHEISEDIDPIEAGLTRFVSFDKGDFVGREAVESIRNKGPERHLTGVLMDERTVPREGAEIQFRGATIGVITSGTFSPTVGKGIGLGYIDVGKGDIGLEVKVVLREKPYAGRLVTPPFYKSRGSG